MNASKQQESEQPEDRYLVIACGQGHETHIAAWSDLIETVCNLYYDEHEMDDDVRSSWERTLNDDSKWEHDNRGRKTQFAHEFECERVHIVLMTGKGPWELIEELKGKLATPPATLSADEEIETPGILRVEGPHECTRSVNDPKDVHYSVFDETGGNVAHFSKREDAEQYVDLISHANEREERRTEQCCECNVYVSEWVEAEHRNGRICRPCEELVSLRATLAAREGELARAQAARNSNADDRDAALNERDQLKAELATAQSRVKELEEICFTGNEKFVEKLNVISALRSQLTEAQAKLKEAREVIEAVVEGQARHIKAYNLPYESVIGALAEAQIAVFLHPELAAKSESPHE